MTAGLLLEPAADAAVGVPSVAAGWSLRPGRATDAGGIHALVAAQAGDGHLLPRALDELRVRAPRFVVAAAEDEIVAAAELAPLSPRVAEVRSLVVRTEVRSLGLGRQLVEALTLRARRDGFERLCAFTHDPGFFVRLGFSIVPHHWVREKLHADCQHCPRFTSCGQYAVELPLRSPHPLV